MSGQYDPKVIEAARQSNEIDDMDPDEYGRSLNALDPSYGDGRGNTHSSNVVGHSFAKQQKRQELREMLPGTSEYGIDQVKANVRGSTLPSRTRPVTATQGRMPGRTR